MKLRNKVIIITGASRGLGREIALELDRENAKLVLAARTLKDLQELQKQLKSESLVVRADLSKESEIRKMFSKAEKRFRRVDVLINNAGINIKKPFYEYTEKEYQEIMDINLKAAVFASKQAYIMNAKRIIIISSMAGWLSSRYYSVYSASKHALEGFVKAARKDSRKRIKFLVFHPYRLDTSLSKNYKHKSPKHRINPRYYAEYVVSCVKGDILSSASYFVRNHILWLLKILF